MDLAVSRFQTNQVLDHTSGKLTIFSYATIQNITRYRERKYEK